MSVFVGREGEIRGLAAALDRALAGDGGLVLLTGEAGIGKTRLAERAAEIATERGARVVWGRCWEAGGAPPYWAWIEVMRELGVEDPFAHAEVGSGAAGRMKLMSDVVSRLRSGQAPLVVVLDDLHAADVPSLMLLHFAVRRLKGARVLLVGTSRDAVPPESAEVFGQITRESTVIPLGRLGRDDVALLAKDTKLSADEVHRVTEGNPLFVVEVVRLGTTSAWPLPYGLRAVLDEHLARLSPHARELLDAASVVGRDFSIDDLAAGPDGKADRVFELLREAESLGVLRRTDAGWSFSHMLFCERLADELPPSKEALLHDRAGKAFLARGAIARAAHHLLEGAVDHDEAARVTLLAIDLAMAKLAFEDAAKLAKRALAIVVPDTERACELRIALAEAIIRAGDVAGGKEMSVAAHALARKSRWPVLTARAALVYSTELASGTRDATMIDLLATALEDLPDRDDPLRARVMARLAAARVPPPPNDEAAAADIVRLAREARAMATRIGDPDTLLYVLMFAMSAIGFSVPADERRAALAEIIDLATRLDRPLVLVQALGIHVAALLEQGRRSESERALERYAKLIGELPSSHYLWRLKGIYALYAMFDGDFDRAEKLAKEALEVTDPNHPYIRHAVGLLRIGMAQMRGVPESIAPWADEIIAAFGRSPAMAPFTGWVYAATNRPEEARKLVVGVSIAPGNFPWLIPAADAAAMIGDAALGAPLYEHLSRHEFSNRCFWGPAGITMLGPTSRVLRDLARVLGKHDEARRHDEEARAFAEKLGARSLIDLLGAPQAPPQSKRSQNIRIALAREGEIWRLSSGEAVVRLKDAKGVAYLAALLERPGQEIHVAELVGLDDTGDAGPVIDAKAKEQYRRRLDDIQSELAEAERFGDRGRAARLREELDALGEELARGVGLGGRDRKAASQVERARINVQRRLRDVIERVREHDGALGRYLDSTVKTGTFCSYEPL